MRTVLLSVAALSLASCAGLQNREIVELYDLGRADGLLEIEMERDGSLRELEVDVAIDSLPAAIRKAALERLPGAKITGAEREFKQEGRGWEVKLRHQNRNWELVYDDAGQLLETEEELERKEAPDVVINAANQAIPGASFKSVERIERGKVQEYHVKLQRDNASYKVVLAPDGKLLRKVREARAEVEIPLRD